MINGVEVSNADKKDRIEKNKSYMMYLYVTSILRKESLLVADLKFVAGDLTHVFREIDWNPGETSCMELELDENEDNSQSFFVLSRVICLTIYRYIFIYLYIISHEQSLC